MKKNSRIRLPVLHAFLNTFVLLCLVGSALAAETEFMSLDEIRPGMKGKAKSVFSGSRIEEFDVEILGILHNWRPGGDLILARASGPQVDYAGIAAGMSGTPVYIDGKLIGAMAYTWAFSKEPITGITPIREMLEIKTPEIRSGSREPKLPENIHAEDSRISSTTMKPIATPLLISGLHPGVLPVIEKQVGSLNMVVAQTGSAGYSAEHDTLAPGAAMAAELVTGDGNVAAIGTVTYVDGRRVLGFGHGLSIGGFVQIPLGTAYVHAVLPSIAGSMKLASPVRTVGTITKDDLSGVAGELGSIPSLIPVDITVKADREGQRKFHFGVMKNKLLTGMLVGWSATSAALTVSGSAGEMTIETTNEIELSDKHGVTHNLKYRDVFFTTDPAGAISKIVSAPVEVLLDNEFEEIDIRHISCDLLIEEEPKVVSIEEISVRPDEVEPGNSVRVTVKLQPFRGEAFFERFTLVIPANCEASRARVLVCSAPEMRAWEEQATNRRLPATNLEQLIARVDSSGRGNRLECVLSTQTEEAGMNGVPFPSPPSSFSNVLDSSSRSGRLVETRSGVIAEAALETGYAVQGCRTVNLKIKSQKPGR